MYLLLVFFTILQLLVQDASGARHLYTPQQPLILPFPSQQDPQLHRNFRLTHIFHHGTRLYPELLRKLEIPTTTTNTLTQHNEDTFEDDVLYSSLPIASNDFSIHRLADRRPSYVESLMSAGRKQGRPLDLPASAWTVDRISGPNVTDKATVLSLARMSANAYVRKPFDPEWEDVGKHFNNTTPFGWEADGLQGHVFADDKNQTIILALKGTSLAVFDGAGTTTNDKENDNLFFSCCCGQGGNSFWRQVCDCKTATYTCNSTCVRGSLLEKDRYYYAAQQLYSNATALFPGAEVWFTGHSLGGATGSLVALSWGLPVVTFEAPGDAMPAARLGLPTPPGYRVGSNGDQPMTGGFHFGQTADPVYMGTCSSCSIAGYAMESICHTGMECRYDTIKDKGYHSWIGNHRITSVIHDVIELYDEPAKCELVTDCFDCFNWKYFESNSSEPRTSTTSSTSQSYTVTRTEPCKTPGWWGCLDESTTTTGHPGTSPPLTTTTKSSSTSTCKTPGWFGCWDDTSTTISTTTSSTTTSTSSTTSTCKTPGLFWCWDEPTTTHSFISTSPITSRLSSSASCTETICKMPGLFWGCWDEPSTTVVATTSKGNCPSSKTTCKTPGWFWGCWDDPSAHTADASPSTYLPDTPAKVTDANPDRHIDEYADSSSVKATPGYAVVMPVPTMTTIPSAPLSREPGSQNYVVPPGPAKNR